jgi:L-alanine-DL-glutamate epimerase-like enolase superfamily enzyme
VSLTVTQEVLHLTFRDPFVIARTDHATGDGVTTVIVEVRDDRFPDVVGVGEGYPDRFYGETPETMAAIFPYMLGLADDFALGLDDVTSARRQLAAVTEAWGKSLRWNGSAKCALGFALHDFAGKALGIPVYELIDFRPRSHRPISRSYRRPAIVAGAQRVRRIPGTQDQRGGPQDPETLRAVREVFTGPIRIDANTG